MELEAGKRGRRAAGSWVAWLAVVALQVVLLLPVALTRSLDADEGFYSIAAKLVGRGQEPYADFWFQHAPALPYVYGAWGRLFGESFYSLRMCSVALTILLGCVLYGCVSRWVRSRMWGFVAVVLFAGSALTLLWYPTIKSYPLSSLLLFVAYALVTGVDREAAVRPRGGRWFAAGTLIGLSVDTRLLFVAVIPVFVLYACFPAYSDRMGTRIRHAALFLGGVGVGAFPTIYFWAMGPRRFIDDTLESQFERADTGLGKTLAEKLRLVGDLVADAQFFVLVAAALVLTVLVLIRSRRVPFVVAVTGTLAVVSLLPTPSYDQYFATVVPLLAVATVDLAFAIRLEPGSSTVSRRVFSVCVASVLGLYALIGLRAIDDASEIAGTQLQPSDVRRVARAIDDRSAVDEEVLSFWPGFVYESHARQLRGVESDFAAAAIYNSGFGEERAAAYRVRTFEDVERAIRDHEIRIVVQPPRGPLAFWSPAWPEVLAESGYRPVATIAGATIFEWQPRTGA